MDKQKMPSHPIKKLSLLLLGAMPLMAMGQPVSSDFDARPPLLSDSAAPNVMLVMSNDHELYKKAYSDYTDLDGDGTLDTTYIDNFKYGGYFDSNFCYSYNSGVGRFEPAMDISDRIADHGHVCNFTGSTGAWSGNFLNWATMTRVDIVRSVLYGGLRVADTASSAGSDGVTVLERAYLPEDIHSFVKIYTGPTQNYTPYNQSAISLCNTTYGAESSDPLMRVAYGSWPQWSASEVVQCHYEDERNSGLNDQPESGDRPTPYDFALKVQACKAGVDTGSDRCKVYTDTSNGVITYKPVGLLQEYGDNGTMNFGLMTGSYNNKISGGVLRKNILPLTGNTNGNDDEIDLNNGTFINQGASDGGIINTLDRLRIVNWNYSNNNYSDCDTYNISIDTFKTSGNENRQCRNWGNPLSEIYLEALRYFSGNDGASGATPTPAFNTSDASQVPSLPQLSWNDPLNGDNYCATCSIIVLSTGLNSFDKDDLSSVTDLWREAGQSRMTLAHLDDLVDEVGDLEGITGSSYLIGNNGVTNNGICTSKTINNFSDAQGLCPEIPSMEGGFDIAGLAYHAHNNDLRNDFEGVQSVNTFSVALAESLPSFDLDVNGKTVRFVPTCQAHGDGSRKLDESGWNDCSLVDVTIESSGPYSGRILVAWEDSHWGNDYDMDGIMRLEWCIGTDTSVCPGEPSSMDLGSGYGWSDFDWNKTGLTDDSVQLRVSVPQAAAGNALRFGYIISGVQSGSIVDLKTNADGDVRSSWPNDRVRLNRGNGEQVMVLRKGNYTIRRLNANSGNRIIYTAPAMYVASSTTTAGNLLSNPLLYAAKYGNFRDLDNDGTPHYDGGMADTREWDNTDFLGNEGADGLPDSYYPVRNPSQLIDSLSQIFQRLSERLSSGTAAAVVTNSSSGLGAIYQAYYYPAYRDGNGNSITWGGVLHSMFIDDSGRFREDNGVKGVLEDTDTDYVVDIYYDEVSAPARTRFQRYLQKVDEAGAQYLEPLGNPEDLENFGSIWNARDVLSGISQNNLTVQRSVDAATGKFAQDAGGSRYVFTWMDSLAEGTVGQVDAGETVAFTADNFNPSLNNNYRYLGLNDSSRAMDLVNYIRGQDQSGWRSRRVDIPGDGSNSVKHWVLGDIIHSSPTVVNPPDSRYDISFGDETYNVFQQAYSHRRQMVYVGGNDGMLHAFNGGVWDSANRKFHTRNYNAETGAFDVGQSHELGAEMWAYVPMSLLPHLQWLKEQNYPHVYYMDGAPVAYDVNIFTPDEVHPGGWGTILVTTMRLGGGPFPLDLDGDSVDETTVRSAIVILDVTDPERPPELIAEISNPNLGYTTSTPALIKARMSDLAGSFANPSVNQWMLVFGSGPDDLSTVTSTGQEAQLFAYDLVGRELVTVHSNARVAGSDPNGFFGDFLAVDWNQNYVDDVLYVGTVEGTENAPSGRLKRIVLDHTSPTMGLSLGTAFMSDVIDMSAVSQAITARPSIRRDVQRNERWLLFGTGRLFTSVDNRSTAQQAFYGVREANDYSTTGLDVGDLIDTTDIIVKTDGTIYDEAAPAQVTIDGTDLDTFDELNAYMNTESGWVRNLDHDGVTPSERVFNASQVLGGSIIFSSYLPSFDMCTVEGDGFLYALNFRTGTAQPFEPFGSSDDGVAFAGVELGQGAPSAPTAVVRTGNDITVDGTTDSGDISVVTASTTGVTTSTGFATAPGAGGRMSWEILDIPF